MPKDIGLPLLEAMRSLMAKRGCRYHTPGHKGRPWLAVDSSLVDMLGEGAFSADLTELPGLDNLAEPSGVLLRSEQLCAEVFGTAHTVLLTCGATSGIVAAILACCRPGDKVLLPRECHRSVLAGVLLARAVPVFYPCDVDLEYDLPIGASADAIRDRLRSEPGLSALIVSSPNYFGVHRDLHAVVEEARSRRIVVIVDEAHGAHLPFVKRDLSALSWRAHIVVHSGHKTLGALTQSAMAHFTTDDPSLFGRFVSSLSLVHTSSPSYPVMASIEAAVVRLHRSGRESLCRLMESSNQLKERLGQLEGMAVFPGSANTAGYWVDPLKVTVKLLRHRASQVERWLIEDRGMYPELVCGQNVLFLLGIGDDQGSLDLLWNAIKAAVDVLPPQAPSSNLRWSTLLTNIPTRALLPAEAFWARQALVPVKEAAGSICSTPLLLYPPGVALIWPGEVFSQEMCDFLEEARANGWNVLGMVHDSKGYYVRVVEER
ncbi:MAG: aminotransferase class I/II-fold pyridoxal phosphate-dependent enzyme [Bacillota bacterium]